MTEKAKKVVVGICAQDKKASGKPMKQILAKLIEFYGESLEISIFPEKMIHEEPIEKWPICDVLICFYSQNFPLEKAVKYVEHNKIWCLNDIDKQFDLLNRATTYEILKANGIPVTRYEVMWRDDYPTKPQGVIQESVDAIVVNGVTFIKPFVEKPVSSEDHNIRIYYPQSVGGGSQQLFRKVLDKSSSYSTENEVRKEGSYIYEDFLQTDGTDVKVYAVGPNYAHAEARKAPALDGRVNRDEWGSEVRYPVILSHAEKLIARKIVLAFKQTVCGFDLLRSDSKSYVCDVNGFSFVKKSMKYYEDAAQILGNVILQKLRPTEARFQPEYCTLVDKTPVDKTSVELRCVLAVIRHGDRTPKQKLKMTVNDKRFIAIFEKYRKNNKAKLKLPQQLQEVLDVSRALLNDIDHDIDIYEDQARLQQLKAVLEMYSFTGINRKVQFRYETDLKSKRRLLLIVKWGGELTDAGKRQAENLGKAFRCLYPGGGQYGNDKRGLGFLRLHSTYRHDLKIYASDEGRVKMTAAAFAKGLLALEGELPPILMQMVKSSTTEDLLGDDKEERQYLNECKNVLQHYLQMDRKLTKSDIGKLNPTEDKSIKIALRSIENPKRLCDKLSKLMDAFCESIERKQNSLVENSDNSCTVKKLYGDETWPILHKRWKKLAKDFKILGEKGKIKQYDILKIPDIYDSIKYDMEHNTSALSLIEMQEIFTISKRMADVVVPQKFGITKEEKCYIAQQICTPLMKKMLSDIKRCVGDTEEEENLTRLDANATNEDIANPFRHIRSRIYFTSESHIHPLMNLIRFDLLSQRKDDQLARALDFLSYITEFNYLSHVVLMLFEDMSKGAQSADRFHAELHFSPGIMNYLQTNNIPDLGYRSYSVHTDPTTTSSSNKTKRSSTKTAPLNSRSEDLTILGLKMESYSRTQREKTQSDQNSEIISRSTNENDDSPNAKDNPYKMVLVTSPNSSEFLVSARSPDSSEENLTINEKTTWINSFIKKIKKFVNNVANRFQSTSIINEKSAGKKENKPFYAPAVMTTAVIGTGSSVNNGEAETLDISNNLHYFVPPVRSLETLHNHISLQEIVSFMERTINDKLAYPSVAVINSNQ